MVGRASLFWLDHLAITGLVPLPNLSSLGLRGPIFDRLFSSTRWKGLVTRINGTVKFFNGAKGFGFHLARRRFQGRVRACHGARTRGHPVAQRRRQGYVCPGRRSQGPWQARRLKSNWPKQPTNKAIFRRRRGSVCGALLEAVGNDQVQAEVGPALKGKLRQRLAKRKDAARTVATGSRRSCNAPSHS